jgi:hypothetical protein
VSVPTLCRFVALDHPLFAEVVARNLRDAFAFGYALEVVIAAGGLTFARMLPRQVDELRPSPSAARGVAAPSAAPTRTGRRTRSRSATGPPTDRGAVP